MNTFHEKRPEKKLNKNHWIFRECDKLCYFHGAERLHCSSTLCAKEDLFGQFWGKKQTSSQRGVPS